MIRGDVVVAVRPRDTGKVRPWVVLSSDRFVGHSRVTVLPLTIDPLDAPPLRIDVAPTAANGLNELSQVMLDRIAGIEVKHLPRMIGHLAHADMQAIERGVLVYPGFA